MPLLLWVALGVSAFAIWWRLSHHYPSINLAANGITLLNFAPYTIKSGMNTYRYVLATAGLNETQMFNSVLALSKRRDPTLGDNSLMVSVVRRNVPLPLKVADLWAVESRYLGPTTMVSPLSVLQDIGVQASSNAEAAQKLADILAISTTPVLVPIAANQLRPLTARSNNMRGSATF